MTQTTPAALRSGATWAAAVLVLIVAATLVANGGAASRLVEGIVLAYLSSALIHDGQRASCPRSTPSRPFASRYRYGMDGNLVGDWHSDRKRRRRRWRAYALAEVFTLCALGAGTLFGLVSYAKPDLITREWTATLVGCGAALGMLIAFVVLQIVAGNSFPRAALAQATNATVFFAFPRR